MNRKLVVPIMLLLGVFVLISASGARAALNSTNFRVNTFTPQRQMHPSAAVAPDGSFIVVFDSEDDAFDFHVLARLYDNQGEPLGEPFVVSQTAADFLTHPDVAMDGSGKFVVVWENDDLIYARRFAANGTPLSDEYQVNQYYGYALYAPAVAMAHDGRYAVTWTNYVSQSLPQGADVYVRVFDADDTPLTGEFMANTYTDVAQRDSDIAFDGAYIILTWQSIYQDGDNYGVFARAFTANGTPQTAEIPVNQTTAGRQREPAVAFNSMGNFAVVWESEGGDGDSYGVMARTFTFQGQPRTDELVVNQVIYEAQGEPSIAVAYEDEFLVAWSGSTILDAIDQQASGIYARWLSVAGQPAGDEMRIDTCSDLRYFTDPAVGGNPNAQPGQWVIAWDGYPGANCDTLDEVDPPEVYAQYGRPPVEEVRYISLDRHGKVNGLKYSKADILRFDVASGEWSLFFDASDVGIRQNLSGFAFAEDGGLLLAFDKPQNKVPGIGRIEPHMIYHFRPGYVGYGQDTQGTLELYFDGTDVGLTKGSERIDGLTLEPDGSILISTIATARVGSLKVYDEDLLRFSPVTLGETTSGVWSLAFDGSAAGVYNDLAAVWVDPTGGDLHLAYDTRVKLDGTVYQTSTVLLCEPQADDCDWSAYWEGANDGLLTKYGIDGLGIRRP